MLSSTLRRSWYIELVGTSTSAMFSNKITVKDNYLLPCIRDHFDHLVWDHDLKKIETYVGFHQVCIKTIDSWETTSKTRFGLAIWFLMPFSLTKALTKLSIFINDILETHLGYYIIIYLNDIISFRMIWDKCLHDVCTILDLPCTNKLHMKRHISSYGYTIVFYLGFLICHIRI